VGKNIALPPPLPKHDICWRIYCDAKRYPNGGEFYTQINPWCRLLGHKWER
jgi:hypothetical protein